MTQERFKFWTKLGLGALVALLVAPVIFLVVKGIVGIALALAVAAVINALVPAFSEWLTHLKYQSMRFVIDHAPVDALIHRAQERWDALEEQNKLLTEQAGTLEAYKKKAVTFARNFPEEAAETQANLKQYEELFAYRVDAYKVAKEETAKFMKVIDKAEAIYQMATADAALGKSFGKNKDFMAVFREKTAFDAIDKASANALGNLRMALLDEQLSAKIEAPAKAITYDANNNVVLGQVLSMDGITVPKIQGAS